MKRFQIENTVLMVIDVQGRLADLMYEKSSLFKHIETMIQAAHVLNIPIHWFEQYPQGLGETKTAIKSLLTDDAYFEKVTFSACGADGYYKALEQTGRKQIIATGIEAHVCVYQTVLELLGNSYEVKLNQQAVSSRLSSNKELALKNMQLAGAEITSTEMILFELMQTAKHPNFKTISGLLKSLP